MAQPIKLTVATPVLQLSSEGSLTGLQILCDGSARFNEGPRAIRRGPSIKIIVLRSYLRQRQMLISYGAQKFDACNHLTDLTLSASIFAS
jgi:hypothetical protein